MILSKTSTIGNGSNETGWSGLIKIIRPSAAEYTQLQWNGSYISTAGVSVPVIGSGQRRSAADVDAVQVAFGVGNIASGEFALYGVKRS